MVQVENALKDLPSEVSQQALSAARASFDAVLFGLDQSTQANLLETLSIPVQQDKLIQARELLLSAKNVSTEAVDAALAELDRTAGSDQMKLAQILGAKLINGALGISQLSLHAAPETPRVTVATTVEVSHEELPATEVDPVQDEAAQERRKRIPANLGIKSMEGKVFVLIGKVPYQRHVQMPQPATAGYRDFTDVRLAAIKVLAESDEPLNPYELHEKIQELLGTNEEFNSRVTHSVIRFIQSPELNYRKQPLFLHNGARGKGSAYRSNPELLGINTNFDAADIKRALETAAAFHQHPSIPTEISEDETIEIKQTSQSTQIPEVMPSHQELYLLLSCLNVRDTVWKQLIKEEPSDAMTRIQKYAEAGFDELVARGMSFENLSAAQMQNIRETALSKFITLSSDYEALDYLTNTLEENPSYDPNGTMFSVVEAMSELTNEEMDIIEGVIKAKIGVEIEMLGGSFKRGQQIMEIRPVAELPDGTKIGVKEPEPSLFHGDGYTDEEKEEDTKIYQNVYKRTSSEDEEEEELPFNELIVEEVDENEEPIEFDEDTEVVVFNEPRKASNVQKQAETEHMETTVHELVNEVLVHAKSHSWDRNGASQAFVQNLLPGVTSRIVGQSRKNGLLSTKRRSRGGAKLPLYDIAMCYIAAKYPQSIEGKDRLKDVKGIIKYRIDKYFSEQ